MHDAPNYVSTPSPVDLDSFSRHPSIFLGADLLAIALGDPARDDWVEPIVDFMRANEASSPALLSLADAVQRGERGNRGLSQGARLEHDVGLGRTSLRDQLRREPRNAVRWIDLALLQTTSGDASGASRSVANALQLARTNRFVVRAAAKFYDHIDETERARDLVVATPGATEDPWLIAAELALSTELSEHAQFERTARQHARQRRYRPTDATEMFAALASIDADAGRDHAAKRMLSAAMEAPNENSIAQAEFETRRVKFEVPEELINRPNSWEALARHARGEDRWADAVAAARGWQVDQVFDPEPSIFLSFASSVRLDDYAAAADPARIGLQGNPKNAIF